MNPFLLASGLLALCYQASSIEDPFVGVSTPLRESMREKFVNTQINILVLDFMQEYMSTKIEGFEKLTGAQVKKVETTQATWFDNIEQDMNAGQSIDLYVMFGNWVPTFVEQGGLLDITQDINDQVGLDWFDIMPAVRSGVAYYNQKVYTVPLDGDVIVMLYRTDLVEKVGLPTPKTWDDVQQITEYYANKDINGDGEPDYANCFSTAADDIAGTIFWSIASSFLQTRGTSQGAFFDTETFDPISEDPNFLKVLDVYNILVQESPFRDMGPSNWQRNLKLFSEGRCVLWYNYPGPTRILVSNQMANNMTGVLNYAPLPGMKCHDAIQCPFRSEDGVNHAPFLASGGFCASVNSRSPPKEQNAALAFALYISDPAVGYWDVAYPGSFLDPLRQRHTVALSNPESSESQTFLSFGWEKRQLLMLKDVTEFNFLSHNYVKDLRILGAIEYQEANTVPHLIKMWSGEATAKETADSISKGWRLITKKYGLSEQRDMYRGTLGLPPYRGDGDSNLIDDIRPIGWAAASLIIATSILFGAWVIRYRKKRVVRSSQPIFLCTICIGTVVMGAAVFPLGIDESIADERGCDMACMSWPWLFFSGFTTAFAALFSKIWRINKIFYNPSFNRIKVTEKDVVVPFLVLFSSNVLVLLLWTWIDPLRWKRYVIDDLNSYGACASEGNAWITFVVLLAIINFSALILANVEAYRARNIDDELSESKYVAIAMASMLQMFIIGAPMLALVHENPSARFFVTTGIIFVICMSLLLLIFVPKIRLARQANANRVFRRGSLGIGSEHRSSGGTRRSSAFSIEGLRVDVATPYDQRKAERELDQYKTKITALQAMLIEQKDIDINPLLEQLDLSTTGQTSVSSC